ncbi:unnamed protein product, partial [Meganyctiphanes norvegica]
IWFLFRPMMLADDDGIIKKLQWNCPNLRLARLDPQVALTGTPLEHIHLFVTGISKWPAAHLSDMLRLGLLFKYGGWYTDSDTICIRDVSVLENMFALGAQNK